MFVYGIRCAPADLAYLPESASADYYLDYGLLIFPHYTRPGILIGAPSNAAFSSAIKLLTEDPVRPHMVSSHAAPEHPRLTGGECAVLAEIQRSFPLTETAWYSVPKIATTQQRVASAGDC